MTFFFVYVILTAMGKDRKGRITNMKQNVRKWLLPIVLVLLIIALCAAGVAVLKHLSRERKAQEDAEFQERVREIYEAEYAPIIDEVRKSASEAIAQSNETISRYKERVEAIQAALSEDLDTINYARDLLDRIYALNEKENKTVSEMDLLESLIKEFNDLDLGFEIQ